MTVKHKVFVSYHHSPSDQKYRNDFETMFSGSAGVFISKSVQIGEISTDLKMDTIRSKIRDEYLRDSTVTIVLIGAKTWQRKHVDWEISSSIRNTQYSTRSGLLGILLPTHPSFGKPAYDAGIVPPRLVGNQKRGFSNIYDWSTDAAAVSRWIHTAFKKREEVEPDNSFDHFINNKSADRWM